MRKRSIALFLVTGLGLLALGIWLFTDRDRINQDGFNRISVGMTEREVESALRCPPWYHGTIRPLSVTGAAGVHLSTTQNRIESSSTFLKAGLRRQSSFRSMQYSTNRYSTRSAADWVFEGKAVSRKLFIMLFLMAGLAVAASLVWSLVPPEPGVTAANYHRIKPGMSQTDIEAILGPPDEYRGAFPAMQTARVWTGPRVKITIYFDQGYAGQIQGAGDIDSRVSTFRRWLDL
jgi:hypothetical protein